MIHTSTMNFATVALGRFHRWLLYLGVIAVPLFLWPFQINQAVELQKVRFFLGYVEVYVALTLLIAMLSQEQRQVWWQRLRHKLHQPLVLLVVLVALLTTAGGLLGVDIAKSFFGNFYRADGLLTLFHAMCFAALVAITREPKHDRQFWRSLGIAGILVSTHALVSSIAWMIQTGGVAGLGPWQGAQGGSFGQPQFLAGWLIVTLPALGQLSLQESNQNHRWLWRASVVLQIAALALTQARAGVVGIAVWLLASAFFTAPQLQKWAKPALVGGAALTIIILGIWLYLMYTAPPTDFYPESRARIFIRILRSLPQRPLLGWGWANADAAIQNPSLANWPYTVLNDVYVDKAHSVLFEYLATTGVLGLLGYVALAVAAFKKLQENPTSTTAGLTLVMYLVHSQLNITSIAEEMLFWLCIGIALQKRDSS